MFNRVLLIDDEKNFRDPAVRLFGSKGFRMEAVGTGKEARQRGKSRRFDFAVVDLRIAEEDGIDVAAELQKLQQDLPVAFLTAWDSDDARKRAAAKGIEPFAWYSKPLPASKQQLDFFCTDMRTSALTDRFRRLALRWRFETRHSSSIHEIAMHPAYQSIIGMGTEAVPLIIAQLRRRPEHWFWALKAITDDDPVPPAARGNLQAMAATWIEWAEEHLPQGKK
ncbi:MAG TPA: response regulator [Thermoanaerobaculia bacterium]